MMSFDEALGLILAEARPLGAESIPLAQASGRVLAEDLAARGDAPRAAVSAMDGYAVRDADLARLPARLPVVARIFAGAGPVAPLPPGACARIFTGAPVPEGADRVVIQELVTAEGEVAVFGTEPGAGRHVRAAGSDFRAGDRLLPAGRRLDYRAMVAAAAADRACVPVFRRPGVIVLGTGDELVEPGQALETPGAAAESVSFGVAALAEAWGGQVLGRRRLPDDPQALEAAAGEALDLAEVVVVTGGASVGERDFARSMFAGADLRMLFPKVAIKPGKPVWFARAGERLVLGLPGNPSSAMVTARLFLAPLLAGLSGGDPAAATAWRTARLAAALKPAGERETFERGRREAGGVVALRDQDSGGQRALAEADVLIRRPPGDPARPAGDEAAILDF